MTKYDGFDSADSTQANALNSVESAFEQYVFFSGDSILIWAASSDEAQEKVDAYLSGDSCPCGLDVCECVDPNGETLSSLERVDWASITD